MKNRFYFRKLLGFGVMVILLGSRTLADPIVTNGDFSTGLSGWTIEYGTVTDGGGYALFDEDPFDLSSTLSQQFIIPALALELSFDVQLSAVLGGASDPFAWPDAFTASLYDNPIDLNPLVSNPAGIDEFFYLDNTGVSDTVGTFDGTTVTLDVSPFRDQNGYLVFDLWGSENGMITSVNLDNVNVSLVPVPSALLLGVLGMGMSAVGLWHRFSRFS